MQATNEQSDGSTEYDDTESDGDNAWFDGHDNVVGNFTKTFKVFWSSISRLPTNLNLE